MSAVGSRSEECKNEGREIKMSHQNKTSESFLRTGSDLFMALCMHILALWIALGDAILEFASSYVRVFDDISFDNDFSEMPNPAEELRNFKRDLLNAHNHCRILHGCPPLVMSEKLTNNAQAWANKLANKGLLLYSEYAGIGENICLLDLEKPTIYSEGEQIAREWYTEIDRYDYSNPGWKKGSCHATQLLWKESKEIGVGIAKIPGQSKFYVVVQYWPAGNSNMPGKFQENVPPRRRQ